MQALNVGHLNYIEDYRHDEVIINEAYERERVYHIHHVINAVIIKLEQEAIAFVAVIAIGTVVGVVVGEELSSSDVAITEGAQIEFSDPLAAAPWTRAVAAGVVAVEGEKPFFAFVVSFAVGV